MFKMLPDNSNYLYYMVEARFDTMTLLELLENRNNLIYSTDFAKVMRASLEMAERVTREYKKPSFRIRECIVDERIYKVEKQSLLTKSFCRLQHFVKTGFPKAQPKLLIVKPMAGHYATHNLP